MISLGDAPGFPAEHSPCCSLRVEGVGLAACSPLATVGSVDLDDDGARGSQVACQPGAVGAGSLHAEDGRGAESVCPPQKQAIPRRGGADLEASKCPAQWV